MNRSGILDALASLLASVGIELPPWGMPVAALTVAAVLLPFVLRNMKTSKARKLLKRASILDGPRRQEAEAEALTLVHDSGPGLVAVADEALRRGRQAVARRAVERLAELGGQDKELRRLRQEMAPKMPASVTEMVLVVERFLDAGLVDEARVRLGRAERRWPRAPEWDALRGRLSQTAPRVMEAASGDAVGAEGPVVEDAR